MEKEQYEILYRLEESHWWYLGMRRIVDSTITKYLDLSKSYRILDAGCGTGGMMQHLRRFGTVTGIDIADEALNHCRRRELARLARGSVEYLPFATNSFDLLVSFDVIYHRAVSNDLLALSEFLRVLSPGGMLVLRVPAYNWLRGSHDVAVHTHRRYSRPELGRKLLEAGFVIQKLTYANCLLFPVAALKRLIEGTGRPLRPDLDLPSPLINRTLLAVLDLEAALLKSVSFPWGLSVLAVAKKAVGHQSLTATQPARDTDYHG
ncbi:MAG: class I SAM-dependent methyltransferase [Chloroflexota bacterium]